MGDYQLRFRQGGERMRPAGRGGSRSLKKILQELALPPWLRDRVPLIYAGDELVAVADLLIAEGWQAKGDSEGWQLQWQWQRGLYE
jgi:tRNA(Ile)-lysidine synthase